MIPMSVLGARCGAERTLEAHPLHALEVCWRDGLRQPPEV